MMQSFVSSFVLYISLNSSIRTSSTVSSGWRHVAKILFV